MGRWTGRFSERSTAHGGGPPPPGCKGVRKIGSEAALVRVGSSAWARPRGLVRVGTSEWERCVAGSIADSFPDPLAGSAAALRAGRGSSTPSTLSALSALSASPRLRAPGRGGHVRGPPPELE